MSPTFHSKLTSSIIQLARTMLSLAARSVARNSASLPTWTAPRSALGARSITNLAKKAYTAKGKASGQGRNGKAALTAEGPFEVKLAMPTSLGGKGDGNNPEQLFALGYASCFLSALNLVAGKEKITLPGNVACEAHVSIGPPSEGPKPFAIAVDLIITSDASSSEEKKKLQEAVEKAHEVSVPVVRLNEKVASLSTLSLSQVCPYSNATRNNVPVTLTVQ